MFIAICKQLKLVN